MGCDIRDSYYVNIHCERSITLHVAANIPASKYTCRSRRSNQLNSIHGIEFSDNYQSHEENVKLYANYFIKLFVKC